MRSAPNLGNSSVPPGVAWSAMAMAPRSPPAPINEMTVMVVTIVTVTAGPPMAPTVPVDLLDRRADFRAAHHRRQRHGRNRRDGRRGEHCGAGDRRQSF